MVEQKAKEHLIEIVAMIFLIGVGLLIVVVLISPRVGSAGEQKEFLEICYEWSTKYNCDKNEYGNLPENNPGKLGIICNNTYPTSTDSQTGRTKTSQDKCFEICKNGCNPLGGSEGGSAV
jgi:hypothetical protein